MKKEKLFSLTSEVFAQAVRTVREVSQLDEHSRVLVRPVQGAVVFSCVGGGMFLNYAVPAEASSAEPLLLDSKDLVIVVSGVKATREVQKPEPINFYLEKQRGGSKVVIEFRTLHGVDVKVNNVKRIATRSLETAPAIPPMPKKDRISISAEDLLSPLSRVYIVASQNSNNPSFCGCNLEFTGKELVLAATDGISLAEVRKQMSTEYAGGCLLPQRFCAKVTKIISPDADLELHVSNRLFFIKSKSTVFGSTRINAKFPEYSDLISDKSNYVDIESSVLVECLAGFSSLVSVDQYKRISLSFDSKSLSIESMGFSTFDIPLVESNIKDKSSLDVNLHLFTILVRSLSADIIRIRFDAPNKPIVLEPVGCVFKHTALLVPLVQRL